MNKIRLKKSKRIHNQVVKMDEADEYYYTCDDCLISYSSSDPHEIICPVCGNLLYKED